MVSVFPVAGRYTQSSDLDLSSLTKEEAAEIINNPLLHRMISLKLVSDIVEAQADLVERSGEFMTPVLIAHAVGDKVWNSLKANE
jgi:hypothetical protein